MASTKAFAEIYNAYSNAAGASNTTAAQTIDDGYGAALHVKLTNGGTGPTLPAQVQIEVSADNSEWYEMGGPMVGSVTLGVTRSWGAIDIPIGVEYLRLTVSGNTGQAVVVNADISEVTALS